MSRVSRRAVCAFTLLLAAFPLASSVRGDEITTFDLSGTFADNSTLSGTITIDTTANTVTEINVGVSATPAIAFNYAPHAYIFPSAGETLIEAYSQNLGFLLLDVPVPSLVGISSLPLGSSITPSGTKSQYQATGGGEGTPVSLVFGTITPAPTPEPASLALVLSGAVAMGGLGLRRGRRT
jgi:hypothetical protein